MRTASSILIADDDEDIRTLLSMILTRAGFRAKAVDSGATALAASRQEPPHIYLLDVRMPDMSGLELCRLLKASSDTARRPVLLMSAEFSSEDVAAGYAAGCDDYLPKPFSPRELIRRVDQLLVASR